MWQWLLTWLWSWFRRKPELELFHPKDRLIYRYFNGHKEVTADPLVLWKKLMKIGPELAIDIKVSKSISKDAETAHNKTVAKIRDMFDLKPVEEQGLTETESLALFEHFLTFCDEVKKNSSPLPTPPMATSDPTEPSSVETSPTSSFSDTGSTEGELVTEEAKK